LDPFKETADINEVNNSWNLMPPPTRFQLFKNKMQQQGRRRSSNSDNPMKKAKSNNNAKTGTK
jgi:hypothetical protein